jgi:hypothetical protein
MTILLGQERRDVIYLKNGDVIKGIIVENVFNDYVRIEFLGGSILSYKYVDIEKITKEPDKAPRTQISNPTSTVTLPQTKSSDVSDTQKTQFSQGTVSIGSIFSYSSFDPGNDFDYNRSTYAIGTQLSSLLIIPTLNFFIRPNLSLDGNIGYMSSEIDYDESGYEDYEQSSTLIGIGATFYEGGLYGGGGFVNIIQDSEDSDVSSKYFELHAGVLRKVSENVFLDFGGMYLFGRGDHEYSQNGGISYEIDNEETRFQFNIGIKAFFSLQQLNE